MPTVQHLVAGSDELKIGESREVDAGGMKVLLIRRLDGSYIATQPLCSHYRLPLQGCVVTADHVRCPWHHSCFALGGGSVVQPPALDGLHTYTTRVENGKVIVEVPETKELTEDFGKQPAMAKRSAADQRTITILGAGAAGFAAAQRLRERGFSGKLTLVSGDPDAPYDRPSLSKNLLAGQPLDTNLLLRPAEWFAANDIELIRKNVTSFDPGTRVAAFMDGQTLECGATLLASGAGPRRLGIAGEGVANVHVLRTAADANRLLDAAKTAKSVAIIGSGFVGMEAAASLRQRGLDVFVISSGQLPYVKQVGEQIGKLFRDVHERNGVLFHFNAKIEMLEIAEGKATAVSLNDGQRVAANLFLVAIGAEPQTGFLPRTILTKDGGVPVDANYAVIGANDVWAAGDIARPPDPRTGRPMRIEHWRTAMQQGRRAADQMLVSLGGGDDDAAEIASGLPYFWTFQFDLGLDYIGHADRWDEIKIEGDLPGANFIARYYEAGKLLAIASANRSQEVAALAEAMEKEWK